MQEKTCFSGRLKDRCRKTLALTLAGAALMTALSGCENKVTQMIHPTTVPPTETVVTEPPATIPPDGNPEDVTCKGSYTVDTLQKNQVVAAIDGQELNNEKLNILYRLAVNGYQSKEGEPAPDFNKPLDTQVCELTDDNITWQQYFLQQAIDGWQAIQSLERRSYEKMIRNELNFEVDPAKHEQYMKDMPINDTVLYGEDASFKLTIKEKPYLEEELPANMKALAENKGYGSLREMVEGEFGKGVTEKDFNDLVYLSNYTYLYFISLSYDFKPTAEQLSNFMVTMPDDQGVVVDFRHIQCYSDEAQVLEDGKVQGDEAVWQESYEQAESLMKKFQTGKKHDDVAFSVMAHDYTRDENSRLTGGLYAGVRKGQLLEPLDTWLFDPARQVGDVDLIKTDYGWHVVYLKDRRDGRTQAAETAFKQDRMKLIVEEAQYNYPMTLDYSKIQLLPLESQGTITMSGDLLYTDAGHERFAEVPVYIQQDYMKAPYGGYKVSSHGCGISALAMLSTYMMDELHTPATLAVQFGHYNGLHGTDWRMFTEAPPELGYFLYDRCNVWGDVEAGLQSGRMSISLQVKGYFTRAGHYLVISELLDDGKVVIRDSNIFNYARLREHKEDKFNPQKLLPNCQGFWIYDNKVITVPNCSRCGYGGEPYTPKLFKEDDYVCHKCIPAIERREVFLNLCRLS